MGQRTKKPSKNRAEKRELLVAGARDAVLDELEEHLDGFQFSDEKLQHDLLTTLIEDLTNKRDAIERAREDRQWKRRSRAA